MKSLKYFALSMAMLALSFSQDVKGETRLQWVGAWASSQQIPEPQNALPSAEMTNCTLRETVHVSRAGSIIRVHLSNAFGTQALHLTSVHVARPIAPGSSRIDPGADHALLFSGSPDVIIPPAAEYVSDPIAYP